MLQGSAGDARPSLRTVLGANGKRRMVTKLAGGLEATSNCEELITPGAGEPGEVADGAGGVHTCQSGALIP